MKQLLLVFLGSGLGGSMRWGVSAAMIAASRQGAMGTASGGWSLVLGTLVVNLTGCFVAGVLGAVLAHATGAKEDLRLLLMVGVLGGYTTFSAFGRETCVLLEQRRIVEAAGYVLVSVIGGLGAAWVGSRLVATA